MIVTFGFGVLLFTCVGVASVAVKAYSSLPPSLVNVVLHFIDFLLVLTQAFCRLLYIVLLFVYSFTTYLMGTALNVVPTAYKVVSTLVSFLVWLLLHFVRGLLGLEEKAINTLSWLVAVCAVFLYVDNKYQHFGGGRPFSGQIRVPLPRNVGDDGNNEDETAAAAAGVNAHRHEDQQLEAENRENENEENALEEADRNRANNDNVQNVQIELDRERVELPVQLLAEESSDEEPDPEMCSVCYEQRRSAALFPCGHTQLCSDCARIITDGRRCCPICQTAIEEFRRIFV